MALPEGERRRSPFAEALEKSDLAKTLKKVFDDMTTTGTTLAHVQGWAEVNHCLPQKVHKKKNSNLSVEPSTIFECCRKLRPYHGVLLLFDTKVLVDQLPLDANSLIKRFYLAASPSKSLTSIALDAGISKQAVSLDGKEAEFLKPQSLQWLRLTRAAQSHILPVYFLRQLC